MLLFIGCSKEVYNIPKNNTKIQTITIVPFANFTQTQMAGYRVAGIVEGVLRDKGFNIQKSLWDYPEEDYTLEEIKQIINNSKERYVLSGYVNEYRYKTGIDGEPAVSVTIRIYDKNLNKYIYKATFSKVGSTYDSLGVITQEALNKVINAISYKKPTKHTKK
jgi:TolB-like protein